MKKLVTLWAGFILLLAGTTGPTSAQAPADSLALATEFLTLPADSLGISADTTLSFSITAGSRLYPDWHEDHVARLQHDFNLGDSQLMGRVEVFMPDFRMLEGKPRNVSEFLQNPAIRIFVYADSGAVDSSWAFLNFPPHFSARSFYTFQLKKIEGYRAPTPPGKATPPEKKTGGSKKEH